MTPKNTDPEPSQVLIETDILAAFLVASESGPEPLLQQALKRYVCYTTMLNAFELLRAARNENEQQIVHSLLTLVRVLGFNARTAIPVAALSRAIEHEHGIVLSTRDALVIGMAAQSKLTILTHEKYDLFTRTKSVPVLRDVATSIAHVDEQNGSKNIFSQVGIGEAEAGVAHAYTDQASHP